MADFRSAGDSGESDNRWHESSYDVVDSDMALTRDCSALNSDLKFSVRHSDLSKDACTAENSSSRALILRNFNRASSESINLNSIYNIRFSRIVSISGRLQIPKRPRSIFKYDDFVVPYNINESY